MSTEKDGSSLNYKRFMKSNKPSAPSSEQPIRVTYASRLPWVGGFFGSISADVRRRREIFNDALAVKDKANEIGQEKTKPKTLRGKLYQGFSRAAHAVGQTSVVHAVTHSRVWKPFGLIPSALHYTRYPLGRPSDRLNAYTKVTVNADFYIQATSKVLLSPVLHLLGRGLGEAGNAIFDTSPEGQQALKKAYPSLYRAGKISKFAWNYGGSWTVGKLYHAFCCEKTPDNQHYFSPLQVANSAAFGVILWGASIVAPFAVAPVLAVAEPYYLTHTEHSYFNMDVMDKSDEDANETFKLYVASRDEMQQAKQRRLKGEDLEDDEIGRRLDIEQTWIYGINNPNQIAGMIPKIGHCDRIDAAGYFFRTPSVKFGNLKLIRAHVWLSPIVRGTQGCRPYAANEQSGGLFIPESKKASLKQPSYPRFFQQNNENFTPVLHG